MGISELCGLVLRDLELEHLSLLSVHLVISSIVESVVEKGGLMCLYHYIIVYLIQQVGVGNPTVCKEMLLSEVIAILSLCQAC